MSKIYDAEISKMRHLIGYGLNENASNEGKPVVEYHAEAADGNTYGILRECNKFYIKVAPKKDTPILAEDYNYIGGYMNKRENEYTTYAVASKQFDLKMKQISEACGSKKAIEQFSTVKKAEWNPETTQAMREEINRFNQIVANSTLIDEGKEGFVASPEHTLPEAPGSHPSAEKVNYPFTKTGAKASLDKDFKNTSSDHSKAAPFEDDVKSPKMDDDKNRKGGENGPYKNKVQESKTVRLTEEQVLAWNKNKEYMDKSAETSVGSSSPFNDAVGCESNQCDADTDPIKEDVAMHNTDNQNSPAPGTSDRGKDDPFVDSVNEAEDYIEPGDLAGGEDEEYDDVPFPEVEDVDLDDDEDDDEEDFDDEDEDDEDAEFEIDVDDDDEVAYRNADKSLRGLDFDHWDDLGDDDDYFDDSDPFESRRRGGERIFEVVLNDFGKHPAWRKQPMTTPDHRMADKHGKDWNDDSAKSDEPYAKEIGSGAPFTEKLSNIITDAVVNMVRKKKD